MFRYKWLATLCETLRRFWHHDGLCFAEVGEVLEESMHTSLMPIKSELESGVYKTVICDDVSARMPVYIILQLLLLRNVREQRKVPRMHYLSGSRKLHEGRISRRYRRLCRFLDKRLESGDHVLIVTEFISTGKSLHPLFRSLTSRGILYDVVCLAKTNASAEDIDFMTEGGRIFYGAVGGNGPLFRRLEHHGVDKKRIAKDIHGFPVREYYNNVHTLDFTEPTSESVNRCIAASRRDAKILAHKLNKRLY